MNSGITKIIIAVILAGGLGLLIANNIGFINSKNEPKLQKNGKAGSSSSPIGQEIPILGRDHVPEGTKVTNYNSNPPTSGNHWQRAADWGFYSVTLPDEQLVHNLEHGGIWISYKDIKDINEETGKKLESIAEKYPQAVIITERPKNDTKFAIASWGRLTKLDSFDQEYVERFIRANINNSPEPLASLEGLLLKVGNIFPDFKVVEVDGKEVTRDSLKGKPSIVWFTTGWCVPCQIGARDVAKVDDELGGQAFNVLVVFVDPRESKDDLIKWRKNFANPDWLVAFDNQLTQLAAKVDLKFLDSKFILDKNGVIRNIDFKIADENYLNTIRQIVKENT